MSRALEQDVNVGSLGNKAWALRQVIERATTATLDEAERGYLRRVEDWVCKVDPLLTQASAGQRLETAPMLDLTRAQLHHLVTKVVIDQTRDPKRKHQLERFWPDGEPLRQHSRSLKVTSWLVAVGLASLVLANVVNILVLKDVPRVLVLEINLSLAAIVFIFWAWHHFGVLLPHLGSVEEHIMQELKLLKLI